jgi:hypothetical protein
MSYDVLAAITFAVSLLVCIVAASLGEFRFRVRPRRYS